MAMAFADEYASTLVSNKDESDESEKFVIGVVGKELFPQRMRVPKEFGEVLYDQLIAVLEMVAEEVPSNVYKHERLGVYLDSNNPDTRCFSMNENTFWKIRENFGQAFYTNLGLYAKSEQQKGANVLFQLNNGNISMSDFEKNMGSK